MKSIIIACFSTLLWIVSLSQDSGIGASINIAEKARWMLIIISIVILMGKLIKYKDLKIKISNFVILALIVVSFILAPYIFKKNTDGLGYLTAFLVCYIFSNLQLDEKCIGLISLVYGILGIAFLSVYNYTSILSGWNSNSIAMVGFFSYTIFYIGFMQNKKLLPRIFVMAVVLVYCVLLESSYSRSCMLFTVISVLFIMNILKPAKWFEKKIVIVLLLIPLIVTFIVCIISNMEFYDELNRWSISNFSKPIFNGREEIWNYGFKVLEKNWFFGSGTLGNSWHNSAITCLTAYGIIGYVAWIVLFKKIADQGKGYFNDSYVCAALTAFFFIYLQQSVELGLIATKPNLIPYVALGIMLGRIKYLRENKEKEKATELQHKIN